MIGERGGGGENVTVREGMRQAKACVVAGPLLHLPSSIRQITVYVSVHKQLVIKTMAPPRQSFTLV